MGPMISVSCVFACQRRRKLSIGHKQRPVAVLVDCSVWQPESTLFATAPMVTNMATLGRPFSWPTKGRAHFHPSCACRNRWPAGLHSFIMMQFQLISTVGRKWTYILSPRRLLREEPGGPRSRSASRDTRSYANQHCPFEPDKLSTKVTSLKAKFACSSELNEANNLCSTYYFIY